MDYTSSTIATVTRFTWGPTWRTHSSIGERGGPAARWSPATRLEMESLQELLESYAVPTEALAEDEEEQARRSSWTSACSGSGEGAERLENETLQDAVATLWM